MKPSELSSRLRQIATAIDNTNAKGVRVSAARVAADLKSVVASISTELIWAGVNFPQGMDQGEMTARAMKLVPGCTGFEMEDGGDGWAAGNLIVPEGTINPPDPDELGDTGEYGPDEAGVSVSIEWP